ncbi:PREDICTED: MHC class I polypeptide-related sequence B [Chrysochloris asiatica]|uniref:MHC class I polypeptide-related sequence B n=1 Tax=Chrysochloris asiatica TaxID=185453 RepID=A0A9B0U2C3_CHRAS|nr:PREDICTED: MHC class I polypeptide-related sequence B [Chrysochloris asiatica]
MSPTHRQQRSPTLTPCTPLRSLCYSTTVTSLDGSVQPRFHTEGHLDDKLFLCYDIEKGQAEPCGPRTETQLAAETSETKDLTDVGEVLRMTLAEILSSQGQKNGLHSFQEKRGCEMKEENLSRGFWNYSYDGEPFLSYDPENQTWTAQRFSALKIMKEWDAHSDKHKDYIYRVQGSICRKLQKYLKSGKNSKEQTVPPAVNVTCTKAIEGNTTLNCCASGFYPPKISLTWLQDGEPMNQYSQDFSDGNGTCMSITVPQGQEQRYRCHLEHNQKNSTYCVTCGSERSVAAAAAWRSGFRVRSRYLGGRRRSRKGEAERPPEDGRRRSRTTLGAGPAAAEREPSALRQGGREPARLCASCCARPRPARSPPPLPEWRPTTVVGTPATNTHHRPPTIELQPLIPDDQEVILEQKREEVVGGDDSEDQMVIRAPVPARSNNDARQKRRLVVASSRRATAWRVIWAVGPWWRLPS